MDFERFLPLIQLARLDILQYGLDRLDAFAIYDRTFGFYGVSYMHRGESMVRFADEEIHLREGDAFLIPPGVRHDHVKVGSERAEFIWWNFTLLIADRLDALRPFVLPRCVHLNDSRFSALFVEFLRLSDAPHSLADVLRAKARAMELVSMILSEAFATATLVSGAPTLPPQMLSDIKDMCAQRALLPALAQKYKLHPTYISNRFAREFGLSPGALQVSFRLESAKQLLLAGQDSISTIAEKLGYDNVGNFSRFFKARTGMSPLVFREGGALDTEL